MNLIDYENGIIELIDKTYLFNSIDDFFYILFNNKYDAFIIHKENLNDNFYELKTGTVDEILQKFAINNKRLGIVGDFSNIKNTLFQDFIYKCNKHKQIIFVKNTEEAQKIFLRDKEILDNFMKMITDFIQKVSVNLAVYYKLTEEQIYAFSPNITFSTKEYFLKEIQKIEPNANITDDDNYQCCGKSIFKDGKNYIFINSSFFGTNEMHLKNKHTIIHELGHCLKNILNSEIKVIPYFHGIYPLKTISENIFSIALDEYMVENYTNFLYSDESCIQIVENIRIYDDYECLLENITTSDDLFNRLWNNPNSTIINLFRHISFLKRVDLNKLKSVFRFFNIIEIINLFENWRDTKNIVYNNLVDGYNTIVENYNKSNPKILQKKII